MAIYYPPIFINEYMKEKVSPNFGTETIPFFPQSPSDIPSLTESLPAGSVAAVFDRMLKSRKGSFPHIKSEQLLYYFYAYGDNAIPSIIDITQHVQDLLDGGDESAEDINAWIRARQASNNPIMNDAGEIMPMPFFHSIKVYQIQETKDIIDFGTARTYAGNKMIIDYDWHKSQ